MGTWEEARWVRPARADWALTGADDMARKSPALKKTGDAVLGDFECCSCLPPQLVVTSAITGNNWNNCWKLLETAGNCSHPFGLLDCIATLIELPSAPICCSNGKCCPQFSKLRPIATFVTTIFQLLLALRVNELCITL